ncbi:uncharacterized protein EDB91DRAFT_1064444 [Suillus paluster]|uniref:uncharacterized protein n=1 Tax=Suillus paluster TaxID=48578 RepID=UPI001B8753B8|nr:uncharacterized protein EDB91DRAFT_1064444 [Suillus paluster]KAG1721314.1 hypothetical protein EDB91DRAFT_1064444 [Suillus paluster]
MAPSLETSSKGCLPLPQTSPVKVLTGTIQRYQKERHLVDPFVETPSENSSGPATGSFRSPGWLTGVAEQAIEGLASTSAAFLISSSPVQSTHSLPTFIPIPITPTRKRNHDLLKTEPESAKEKLYQDALRGAYDRETHYKSSLAGMQSAVVLQSMSCDRLSSQLAAQEEKKKNSKKGGQLVGDGLPRLLTSDEFHHRVVEHQRAAEEEEAGREARRMEREGRTELLKSWKEAEAARLVRNEARRTAYRDQVKMWEAERDRAKLERQRPAWNKPKLGKLEAPLPRPTLNDPEASEESQQDGSHGDEEGADENDGDESDGGSE